MGSMPAKTAPQKQTNGDTQSAQQERHRELEQKCQNVSFVSETLCTLTTKTWWLRILPTDSLNGEFSEGKKRINSDAACILSGGGAGQI